MHKIYLLLFVTVLYFTSAAQQEWASIGDLETEKSGMIYDCQVSYRTFGDVNADKSNIVLFPTWFGGSSNSIAWHVGKDKIVDTTKYFVIAVDALGNGYSTSPSIYAMEFPDITITDMVRSQYKMLTEVLGIDHLHAVIGGSMGSMQAFEWDALYPGFADKIIPYVATPASSTFDLLRWNHLLNIIEVSRKYNVPEGEIQKILNMNSALFARTPDYIVDDITREGFPMYLNEFKAEEKSIFTIDNYKAQLKAMIDHNIYKHYNNMIDKTAENLKAEYLIIVSETDHVLHPAPALELAKVIGAETLILKNNCGHLAPGCDYELFTQTIRNFLDK